MAWTAVANSIHSQAAAAAAAAAKSGHGLHAAASGAIPKAIYAHALSVGFSKGFLLSSAIALLALIVTIVMIRVRREDLAGVNPMVAG